MPLTIDPVTGQLTNRKARILQSTDASVGVQDPTLTSGGAPRSATSPSPVSSSGPVASQPLTSADPSVTATLPGTSGGVDPTTGQVTYYNPTGTTPSATPQIAVQPNPSDPTQGQFVVPGTNTPFTMPGASGSTAFNFSQYSDPKAGMLAALNSGQFSDPEALVQAANQAYGLGYGASFANYAQKGVIANAPSAGGGYFAKGPDGKWGWNPGDSGGGTTSAATTTTSALQPGAVTATQMDPQLHQAILDLLQRGTTPVDPNDPTIRGVVDAANVTGQRGLKATQAALAERSAYTGAPTSTIDQGVAAAGEQLGEKLGGLQASLMVQELQNRRADVVNALSFAQGQDAQALQLQLRQIDDAIARAQLGQQNQQFYDTMGYNIGVQNQNQNDYLLNLLLNG